MTLGRIFAQYLTLYLTALGKLANFDDFIIKKNEPATLKVYNFSPLSMMSIRYIRNQTDTGPSLALYYLFTDPVKDKTGCGQTKQKLAEHIELALPFET